MREASSTRIQRHVLQHLSNITAFYEHPLKETHMQRCAVGFMMIGAKKLRQMRRLSAMSFELLERFTTPNREEGRKMTCNGHIHSNIHVKHVCPKMFLHT